MSSTMSNEFAVKVAELLKLPIEGCTGMVISLEVGEPVRIRASYLRDSVASDKVFVLLNNLEALNESDNSK
jgi:hypothetical protein